MDHKELQQQVSDMENALLRVLKRDQFAYLSLKKALLETILQSHGWDSRSDVNSFPYKDGGRDDPSNAYISEHLGLRIGMNVIANGDVDDHYYDGTHARITDIEGGMLNLTLVNGVEITDSDPHIWEESSTNLERKVVTWENLE